MRAAFYTLGCKVNQYETAVLERQFSEAGYEIVDAWEHADVYVVNSCTVTAEGDRKSLRALRRMRRRNPSAIVCLCGCLPQAFPDLAERVPEADIIMGSKDRSRLLAAVEERLRAGGRVVSISPHEAAEAFEDMVAGKPPSKTRAFLKIEDGCDRFCAYCIIPSARGPVRSKPAAALLRELEALARSGCAEVVLAGVNLSCYGRDMGLRLSDAVKLACGVEGIARVRLSSLEPDLLTPEDVAEMAGLPGLCPHFHLSLQSGCAETLRRMNRRYGPEDYRDIVRCLRGAFPGCAITTDIMVGFPGETDEEFSQSLEFCREMGFAKAHVFAYSQRRGTVAADMPGQVAEGVKRGRSGAMLAAMNVSRALFLKSQLGKPARVLFETRRTDGRWEGYSENYTPVLAENAGDLSGRIVTIVPTAVEGDYCVE